MLGEEAICELTSNCTKAPGRSFFFPCLIFGQQVPNRSKSVFRSAASCSTGTLVERLHERQRSALSCQTVGVATYLPTKMQALGRNSPCAFLPEGASFRRSPRRGTVLSTLGGTTVILEG